MPRSDSHLLARAPKTVQSSEPSPASMRWISRSRKEGTTLPRTTKVRTIGKYGCIAAVSSARDMPASRAYSDCAAALVARGRSGLSAISGASSDRMTCKNPRSTAAGARIAKVQSTSFGPSAVMITLPGLRSQWQSPSPGDRRSISARTTILAVVVMTAARRTSKTADCPVPVVRLRLR
jgi:hypothetical protein